MSKTVLIETIMPDRKLVEATTSIDSDGQKFVYLKGLFLEGKVRNHNGRIYPSNEIENGVNQLVERIKQNGPIAGELDHPEGLNLNMDRISHAITEMRFDGNNGFGAMRIINAGMGLIAKGAVEAGIRLGVSSRGSGNVDDDGTVSDFDIVTIDIVANPSAPHAYPKASLSESIAKSQYGAEAVKLSYILKDDPNAQKHLANAFKQLFTDIRDQYTWRR